MATNAAISDMGRANPTSDAFGLHVDKLRIILIAVSIKVVCLPGASLCYAQGQKGQRVHEPFLNSVSP